MTEEEWVKDALAKQVGLLKRTVDLTPAFDFVDVPVEVLRVLIEDHELLATVTTDRDALRAQLEQQEHDTIIEVGSAIWDRDKAQEECDVLKADQQYMEQALGNLPGDIGRLVLTEYRRLKHAEVTK